MTAAPLPGPDQGLLKKLRLRIETDDPLYPGWRKLKIRGKDLNDLPSEVFWLDELEVADVVLLVCSREPFLIGVLRRSTEMREHFQRRTSPAYLSVDLLHAEHIRHIIAVVELMNTPNYVNLYAMRTCPLKRQFSILVKSQNQLLLPILVAD